MIGKTSKPSTFKKLRRALNKAKIKYEINKEVRRKRATEQLKKKMAQLKAERAYLRKHQDKQKLESEVRQIRKDVSPFRNYIFGSDKEEKKENDEPWFHL